MVKDKSDYEAMIRASILFTLDRKTQATTYRREALKMVEYLYLYLNSINAEKYREFGLEIVETANRCIKNYVPDSGDFLNYFNSAISKEYKKAHSRQQIANQHGGMHIPDREQRVICQYIKLAEHNDSSELTTDKIRAISSVSGFAYERVEQCIRDYRTSFVISEYQQITNEQEVDLLEIISANESTERCLLENEDAISILFRIDEVYRSRQKRQKPMLSKLLTAKIAFSIRFNSALLDKARTLAFFDESTFIEACNRDAPITSREIAESFGISESSISRSFNNFLTLLG